ncbi:hypothetical protein BD626DRAFT_573083 [Schizophyllum amplum]|uniref:MYND-type domain-containing protein n=1 Tax=Schizophyllum amplum TaxID=97359 RepID=A0A550C2R9_9AGAR|nr:hypothetical protein BD626DRAFT_573083 [Auriculariopsis ampla]
MFSTTVTYGSFNKGRRLALDAEEAVLLLTDLWLNYFEYAPRSSPDWEVQALRSDIVLVTAVTETMRIVPSATHPDAKRMADCLLAAAQGSSRTLYRKALAERLTRYMSLRCMPAGTVDRKIAQELAILFKSLQLEGCPRDVVYAIVQVWKDSASLTDGVNMGVFCAQLLTLFHCCCLVDFRYLTWAIRAGAVPLLLKSARKRAREATRILGVEPFLLRLMRVQMVHRNFMRVLRRYAGSVMHVQDLKIVDAWLPTAARCRNPACTTTSADKPPKKCVCNFETYCSRQCQQMCWSEHIQLCGRYGTCSLQVHLDSRPTAYPESRTSVLADIAALRARTELSNAKGDIVVFVDFSQGNDPAANDLHTDPLKKKSISVKMLPRASAAAAGQILVQAQMPLGGCAAASAIFGKFREESLEVGEIDTDTFQT